MAFNRAAKEALRRVYGVEPQVGHSLFDALAHVPAEQTAVKAFWQRALDGEAFVRVAELGDPARERRTYEIKSNTLRGRDGAPIGAYQFVTDVTERLQEQARLRHAEEALAAVAEAGIDGPAHRRRGARLQQPAGSRSQRHAAARMRSDAAASRSASSQRMRRAVERGTDLTRHLLAFARRQAVQPAPIDLRRHLKGMREMLRALAARRPAGRHELRRRPLAGRARRRRVRARGAEPLRQRPRRDARRRHDLDQRRATRRKAAAARAAGRLRSACASPTPASAWRPRCWTASSSRSSPPRRSARARGWAWPQVYGFASQAGGGVKIESGPASARP